MGKLKLALAALVMGAGFAITGASAMPAADLGTINAGAAPVDQVRIVCNRWGRCWRVGGWRYRYGWRRPWRHRYRW